MRAVMLAAISMGAGLAAAAAASAQPAPPQDIAPVPAAPARTLHPSNKPPVRVPPPPLPVVTLPPLPAAPEVPLPEGAVALTQRSTVFSVRPVAEYPVLALREAVQGRCRVVFTVDKDGVPHDIKPYCTHPYFEPAVILAVGNARIDMNGEIAPGTVLLLPFAFLLGE